MRHDDIPGYELTFEFYQTTFDRYVASDAIIGPTVLLSLSDYSR